LLKRTFPRCTGNESLIRSYCSSVIFIVLRLTKDPHNSVNTP
jgi:hypothetical protein